VRVSVLASAWELVPVLVQELASALALALVPVLGSELAPVLGSVLSLSYTMTDYPNSWLNGRHHTLALSHNVQLEQYGKCYTAPLSGYDP